MKGNACMKVRNCTENDALALAYYLYQLCEDIDDMEENEVIENESLKVLLKGKDAPNSYPELLNLPKINIRSEKNRNFTILDSFFRTKIKLKQPITRV